jgi:MFS family permease
LVVTAVLVVSFGRIGDMFGRVKMYNLGFAIFTLGSLAASLTYFGGVPAAVFLIAMRIVQGIGGAMIMANSTAILTDAFPANQRGMALGINSVADIAGSFIGLVVGGLLAAVDWHLIFYVSVPIGVAGTLWAYLKLQEVAKGEGGRLDLPGNILFGAGLIAVLVGITYAPQPYGGSSMGWGNPLVLCLLIGGVAMLAAFVVTELRTPQPMFDMRLFRIRAFTAGVMNAVPANRRGVASGMRSTFQNAGMTLSIGLFFSIMVAGLSGSLSSSLSHGLTAAGLPPATAARVAGLAVCLVAAAASWLRGGAGAQAANRETEPREVPASKVSPARSAAAVALTADQDS